MAKTKGVSGGIRVKRGNKSFRQNLALAQAGARAVKTKRGTKYVFNDDRKVGLMLSKKQALAGIRKFAKAKYGIKKTGI